MQIYNEIHVLFINTLLYASALTAPPSGRTLSYAQNTDFCNFNSHIEKNGL